MSLPKRIVLDEGVLPPGEMNDLRSGTLGVPERDAAMAEWEPGDPGRSLLLRSTGLAEPPDAGSGLTRVRLEARVIESEELTEPVLLRSSRVDARSDRSIETLVCNGLRIPL